MRTLASILMLIMCAGVAVAQQVSVNAELSRGQITVGQPFNLIVKIENEFPDPPVIPDVDGLDINRSNPSTGQSSSFSLINGRMQGSTVYTYTYQCYANKEGDFTIPPISVKVGGRTYKTNSLSLKVLARGERSTPRADASGRTQITYDDVVFLESSTNTNEVYQGEAIISTVEIWQLDSSSVYVSGGSIYPPEVSGAQIGRVSKLDNRSRRETLGSLDYVVELWQCYIYPQGIGDIEIGPWRWSGAIQAAGVFSLPRNWDCVSPRVNVSVKALPERPDSFSGAVGDFVVRGTLDQSTIVQGQPTAYIINVRGEGVVEFVGAPEFPKLDWAAVSEPKIGIQRPAENNNWIMDKSFLYEITPVKTGNFEIPAIPFTYFDPKREQYITKTLDPLKVAVESSGEGPGLVSFGGQGGNNNGVTILADDIYPIITETGSLHAKRSPVLAYTSLITAPPLGFALFVFYARRRKRLENDPRFARKYFARSKSQQRLAAMDTSNDPAEAMYRALLGFVADLFNVNEAGLTSADARILLDSNHTDKETADSVVKILRACERRRYGGGELSANELGAMRKAAEHAMDMLEATVAKGATK